MDGITPRDITGMPADQVGDLETIEIDLIDFEPMKSEGKEFFNVYPNQVKDDQTVCQDQESKPRFSHLLDHDYHIVAADVKLVDKCPSNKIHSNNNQCSPENSAPSLKLYKIVRKRGNLKCLQCSKFFESPLRLYAHKVRVHRQRFVCSYCRKHFTCKRELSAHKRIHNRLKTFDVSKLWSEFSPTTCSINYPEVQKKSTIFKSQKDTAISECGNEKGTTQRQYECYFCPDNFNHRDQVEAHELANHKTNHIINHKTVDTAGAPCFSCNPCGKSFESERFLYDHLKREHKGTYFGCDSCEKVFFSRASLYSHIKNIHNKKKYDCNLCEMFFERPYEWTQHLRIVHLDKKFSCNLCPKIFETKESLEKHVKKRHTHALAYSCRPCKKTYKTKSMLYEHTTAVHKGMKFFCAICKASFKRKLDFDIHIESVHQGKRALCELCGRTFMRTSQKTEHFKVSHQGFTFDCKVCGKGFSNRSALLHHTQAKHESKAYRCQKCQKDFPSRMSLRGHMRSIHGGLFNCEVCGMMFKTKPESTIHLKLHKDKKSDFNKNNKSKDYHKGFSCNLCFSSFPTEHALNVHIDNSHGLLKPKQYCCRLCDINFVSQDQLTDHYRKCNFNISFESRTQQLAK